MSKTAKTFGCALLLMAAQGCGPPGPGGGGGGGDGFRYVKLYNCTHVNDVNAPPSGRGFNIYTRVADGQMGGTAWVSQGGLNPQPGAWSDCHDDPHKAASLTIDLFDPPGKWEIRAIKLPRGDEPQCDSSAPDVPNACSFLTYSSLTNITKGTMTVDVTDVGR